MAKNQYKGKNVKDLAKDLSSKQEAMNKFRFTLSSGKAKNNKEGRNLRKEIAQILTEMNAAPKVVKASVK